MTNNLIQELTVCVPMEHLNKQAQITTDPYGFLIDLTTALLAYGTPSHRIEPIVNSLATALGISVQVYYLPTYTLLDFLDPDLPTNRRPHHIIKTRGGWDFARLQPLHKLCKDLVRNNITPECAKKRLVEIKNQKEEWSELWIAAGYPLSAATSAIMFFNGDGWDALMSGVLACVPAGMRLLANKYPSLWVSQKLSFTYLESDVVLTFINTTVDI